MELKEYLESTKIFVKKIKSVNISGKYLVIIFENKKGCTFKNAIETIDKIAILIAKKIKGNKDEIKDYILQYKQK